MEKRKRSVKLSFVILRYGLIMMLSMFICSAMWLCLLNIFESRGIVLPGHVSNEQIKKLIDESPDTFKEPDKNFLGEYALVNKDGELVKSNVEGKKLKTLLKSGVKDNNVISHTYKDKSTAYFRWRFIKEFSNPAFRKNLPAFEYLWWITLCTACVMCLFCNVLSLKKMLSKKLELFSFVSEKVGAQKLDFVVPTAGIKEFDAALFAMEKMRKELYSSLTSQWAAQQERDSEMAALAHDLKTPITLIGGYAELLLEEDLTQQEREMVEKILSSNQHSKQYVSDIIEASKGENESIQSIELRDFLEKVCEISNVLAQSKKIELKCINNLSGRFDMRKDHLSRAVVNIVQNAIEHTLQGGTVRIEGTVNDGEIKITVQDEGDGFSKAAILHAKERLWRGDKAREANGHNGLGLWFASEVIKSHGGELTLRNSEAGGLVTIRLLNKLFL